MSWWHHHKHCPGYYHYYYYPISHRFGVLQLIQISLQRHDFDSKFQVHRVASHQSFLHGWLGQWMPYKFAPDSFHTGVTAEALWAKIDDFARTRSLWSKISGTRGRPPPIIFARLGRPMNALQLCCWQFSHKETL